MFLLVSGASAVTPDAVVFTDAVTRVCADLARQAIADAEGASKEIEIRVEGARSLDDALNVARAISRSNLLKCAIHGEDPNWGRVLSAIGTTDALFDPDTVDVAINGVWVCKGGAIGESRDLVDIFGAHRADHRQPRLGRGAGDVVDERPDRRLRPRELRLRDLRRAHS